jgi:hypothetical protein
LPVQTPDARRCDGFRQRQIQVDTVDQHLQDRASDAVAAAGAGDGPAAGAEQRGSGSGSGGVGMAGGNDGAGHG